MVLYGTRNCHKATQIDSFMRREGLYSEVQGAFQNENVTLTNPEPFYSLN